MHLALRSAPFLPGLPNPVPSLSLPHCPGAEPQQPWPFLAPLSLLPLTPKMRESILITDVRRRKDTWRRVKSTPSGTEPWTSAPTWRQAPATSPACAMPPLPQGKICCDHVFIASLHEERWITYEYKEQLPFIDRPIECRGQTQHEAIYRGWGARGWRKLSARVRIGIYMSYIWIFSSGLFET